MGMMNVRIIRKKLKVVAMAGILSAMVTACRWGNLSYSASASVPQSWTRMDTVEFMISDNGFHLTAGRAFQFVVDVRYTGEYAYRDLWLLLRHNVADSLKWQTDTLCCPLYSQKGRPLGQGLTGLYTIEIPYTTLVADGSGQTRMQLIHCMANDSLKGISDVGIRVRSLTE